MGEHTIWAWEALRDRLPAGGDEVLGEKQFISGIWVVGVMLILLSLRGERAWLWSKGTGGALELFCGRRSRH